MTIEVSIRDDHPGVVWVVKVDGRNVQGGRCDYWQTAFENARHAVSVEGQLLPRATPADSR